MPRDAKHPAPDHGSIKDHNQGAQKTLIFLRHFSISSKWLDVARMEGLLSQYEVTPTD